jgi:hypothetical protein
MRASFAYGVVVASPTRGGSSAARGEAMAAKKRSKRYGTKASQKVEKAMHERKRGKLRSGSGKKVKSRKQAIAIGLSQARRAGGKVPAKKKGRSRSKGKSKKS